MWFFFNLTFTLNTSGKYVACLDKGFYLENRRFLPENYPLRSKKKNFPDQKTERRLPRDELTTEDILWNSVSHSSTKNKSQASNFEEGYWFTRC